MYKVSLSQFRSSLIKYNVHSGPPRSRCQDVHRCAQETPVKDKGEGTVRVARPRCSLTPVEETGTKEDWTGRVPDSRAVSRKPWPGLWDVLEPRHLLEEPRLSQEWACTRSLLCSGLIGRNCWQHGLGFDTATAVDPAGQWLGSSVTSDPHSRRAEFCIFMATPLFLHPYTLAHIKKQGFFAMQKLFN